MIIGISGGLLSTFKVIQGAFISGVKFVPPCFIDPMLELGSVKH